MTTLEKQFAQTVAEHKSTIYTACYMFSKDADEVNDLFQEVLVNLWKGFESFEHRIYGGRWYRWCDRIYPRSLPLLQDATHQR